MKEAIKGQDKLKFAVEMLEAEIFKDWPTYGVKVTSCGMLVSNQCKPMVFTNCYFRCEI